MLSTFISFRDPLAILSGLALIITALTSLSGAVWYRWNWRGFVAGVLVGLGILLLAAGLCFVMLL